MTPERIDIPKWEYEELIQAQCELIALQSAGVDNWSGYDYAMEILEDMDEECG